MHFARVSGALGFLSAVIAPSAAARAQRGNIPTWPLSGAPVVAIGGDGTPATEFLRIRATFRLRDGLIAVVNTGSNEIRVFDAQGKHVRTFGRTGRGPGNSALSRGPDGRVTRPLSMTLKCDGSPAFCSVASHGCWDRSPSPVAVSEVSSASRDFSPTRGGSSRRTRVPAGTDTRRVSPPRVGRRAARRCGRRRHVARRASGHGDLREQPG